MGPLMLDLAGCELEPVEQELLAHPTCGGVILFSRNYHDVEQLKALNKAIRSAAKKPILIAVDHEGGRVQRFREQFTAIPAMGALGRHYQKAPEEALEMTQDIGWLLAAELAACGIDLSFTPVLDLDLGSKVIGDRAFFCEVGVVKLLAKQLILGMRQAGFSSVGKHFPGHGTVEADSHFDAAIDEREYEAIFEQDMQPFLSLLEDECLDALMPAHVIYPKVDKKPAGFSSFWLQEILRKKLAFKGVIFSDDLSMEAAGVAGDHLARAISAHEAGCDMLLACNNRAGVELILDGFEQGLQTKAQTLLAKGEKERLACTWQGLKSSKRWQDVRTFIEKLDA